MKQLIGYGVGLVCLGIVSVGTASAQPQNNNPALPGATGNITNFPVGTQIYRNGAIVPPRGQALYPNSTVRHGDGTTTFYYPNGTKITTRENTINPSGTYLSPGLNGGLQPITPIVPPQRNRF